MYYYYYEYTLSYVKHIRSDKFRSSLIRIALGGKKDWAVEKIGEAGKQNRLAQRPRKSLSTYLS